jgi:hypothetical protein
VLPPCIPLQLIYNTFKNRIGFWSAMASNLTNQSRNVISKKVLADKEVIFSDKTFFVIYPNRRFTKSQQSDEYCELCSGLTQFVHLTGIFG